MDTECKTIPLWFASADVEIARHCGVPAAWEGVNEVA
jgi:hypothetical protein